MKKRLIWAVVLAIGYSHPTLAAPDPKDAKTISDCLEKATEDGSFGAKCIGAVADPCIAAPREAEEDALKKCAARELAVWTARLPLAMTLVEDGKFDDITAAAKAAQTEANSSRNKLCAVFENIDDWMPVEYCKLRDLAVRVLLLEHLGAAVNEH